MMVITVMMIIMVMRVKKRMILELKTTAIKLITPIELTIIKLLIQMIVMIIIIKIDNHQRRYCFSFYHNLSNNRIPNILILPPTRPILTPNV